jgi:hypothetical protein
MDNLQGTEYAGKPAKIKSGTRGSKKALAFLAWRFEDFEPATLDRRFKARINEL